MCSRASCRPAHWQPLLTGAPPTARTLQACSHQAGRAVSGQAPSASASSRCKSKPRCLQESQGARSCPRPAPGCPAGAGGPQTPWPAAARTRDSSRLTPTRHPASSTRSASCGACPEPPAQLVTWPVAAQGTLGHSAHDLYLDQAANEHKACADSAHSRPSRPAASAKAPARARFAYQAVHAQTNAPSCTWSQGWARTDSAHFRPSRRTFFGSPCACERTTGPKTTPPPRICMPAVQSLRQAR